MQSGPIRKLGRYLLSGRLLWIILTLLIASLLLTTVAAGPGVLPGDVVVTRAVQAVAFPGAANLAHFTNWIGAGPQFTVLAVALIVMLAISRLFTAAGLILAATLIRVVTPVLKAIAASPRPTADLVHVSEHPSSQGFPSGHVMSATLIYGAIVYLAQSHLRSSPPRHLVQILAVFMMLATGFGRVFTGAHWPSDVLGSYLWGTTLLLLLTAVHRRVSRAVNSGSNAA